MEHDGKSEPESDFIMPSSMDALDTLQTLQTYVLGRGDDECWVELRISRILRHYTKPHGPEEVSDQDQLLL